MDVSCGKCQNMETKAAPFRQCSRCKSVRYCSEACQRSDWKLHKPTCAAAVTAKAVLDEAFADLFQSWQRSNVPLLTCLGVVVLGKKRIATHIVMVNVVHTELAAGAAAFPFQITSYEAMSLTELAVKAESIHTAIENQRGAMTEGASPGYEVVVMLVQCTNYPALLRICPLGVNMLDPSLNFKTPEVYVRAINHGLQI